MIDINKILGDYNIVDQNFSDITITECGREQCVAQKYVFPAQKPYYLFHVVNNGHGTFIQEGREYKLSAGDVFAIFPDTTVEYYPDKSDPWGYTWVGFKGIQADRCVQLAGFTKESPVCACRIESGIRDCFAKIFEAYADYNRFNLMSLGQLYSVFFLLQHERKSTEEKKLTQKEKHIRDAIIFIYYNYQFDITVGDIAGSLNLNLNYLCNIFQEILSMSPKQCVIMFRMKRARDILDNLKYKVKDVAAMVGYSNQLHFSKQFKRYYGCSPSDYRANRRLKEYGA